MPQKYFVERIAGNSAEVHVLVPPGRSPATYEPTPKQVTALGRPLDRKYQQGARAFSAGQLLVFFPRLESTLPAAFFVFAAAVMTPILVIAGFASTPRS